MKSIREAGNTPAGQPLLADDVVEFHAARLLLLFRICGTADRVVGLTKMAKLDFFVRYPDFFAEVCKKLGETAARTKRSVESSMVRHHYGPWDPRYYHVLAYLEGKELIRVSQDGRAFCFELTEAGRGVADALKKDSAFSNLCEHMKQVEKVLGRKAGSTLKKLIYNVFQDEVASRPLGEAIQ